MQVFHAIVLLVTLVCMQDVVFSQNDTTVDYNSTSTANTTTATTVATASSSADTQNVTTTTASTTTTTAKPDTVKYELKLKIDMNVSNVDFTNKSSDTYKSLEKNCSDSLFAQFNSTLKGLQEVKITNLSSGSLNIEFQIVINTTVNTSPQTAVASVIDVIRTSITIGGQSYNTLTDTCTLLEPVCTAAQTTCRKDSDGKAYCPAKSSSAKTPLIVSLIFGLPLFASWWISSY